MTTLSKKKRALFSIIAFFLFILIIEGFVTIGYRVLTKQKFPRDKFQLIIKDLSSLEYSAQSNFIFDNAAPEYQKNFVSHPYLGFVPDLNDSTYEENLFLGKSDKDLTRSDDKLIVAFFGGSFAGGVFRDSGDIIATQLEQVTGKQVVLLSFAVAGYKQPQQVIGLTYLETLGAEFDIIINIDGYNEVSLSYRDNVMNGVFPFYPRDWNFRGNIDLTPQEIRLIGKVDILEEQQISWATFFEKTFLKYSNSALLIWEIKNTKIASSINEILGVLENPANTEDSYQQTGPKINYSDSNRLFSDVANMWMRSSLQMDRIATGNGAQYFHFVQPNQYDPSSKILSNDEIAIAIHPNSPNKISIPIGYPLLRERGEMLIAQGVNFFDLTMIFEDNSDILYKDTCCHLYPEGYDIFAQEIIRIILETGIEPKE